MALKSGVEFLHLDSVTKGAPLYQPQHTLCAPKRDMKVRQFHQFNKTEAMFIILTTFSISLFLIANQNYYPEIDATA